MDNHTSIISLMRKKSISNHYRQFSVIIDDKKIGGIDSGKTTKYQLASGKHTIRLSIDFYKSEPFSLSLRPGETIALECGDTLPTSFNDFFSVKGVESSVNALLNPGQYLYVRKSSNRISYNNEPIKKQQLHKTEKKVNHRKTPNQAIFISYRRDDSREITGRICDRLVNHFGKKSIFRDVDSIPLGVDFRDQINMMIGQCNVVLVIIGNDWLDARDAKGRRRLDLPEDYVRIEIESALQRKIPVIPVMVKNAARPEKEKLPESLRELHYRNAIFIPLEPYFHAGVDLLIERLQDCGRENEPQKENTQIDTPDFCTGCGGELLPGNKFCVLCGKALD